MSRLRANLVAAIRAEFWDTPSFEITHKMLMANAKQGLTAQGKATRDSAYWYHAADYLQSKITVHQPCIGELIEYVKDGKP